MKVLLLSAVLLSSTAVASPMSAPQRMAPRPSIISSGAACPDTGSRNPGSSVSSAGRGSISNHIIVQGGIAPTPRGGGDDPAAIGPKQDDPSPPHPTDIAALGPKQDDPGPPPSPDFAALGPKQDDPGPPPSPKLIGCKKAPSH